VDCDTALTFDTSTDTLAGPAIITGASGGLTINSATNGNISIDPGGSGTTTINAGSGAVNITTDAGNADITLTPHGTGDVIVSSLTASEIVITDASKGLQSAAVATYPSLTELTYVKGVTSAIQTQINAKGVGDALTSNGLDQFAATTSLELKGVISDETGSGSLVFATSPTLVTPVLGTPSSGNLGSCTAYPGDSSLVTTGALNSGSITSGFGAINNGASAITTTGTVTAGELDMNGDILLGNGTGDKSSIILNDSALADESWSGTTIKGTGGATIAVGDLVYLLAADSEWYLTDGILDGTDDAFKNMVGICVLASTDGNPIEVLVDGLIASAAFPALTVGAPVYMSDTAGDVVVSQPSTTNFAIRIMGYALTATVMHFRPSNDYIVHV
jgi:hypothetical protein